jgi:hypothetical protein
MPLKKLAAVAGIFSKTQNGPIRFLSLNGVVLGTYNLLKGFNQGIEWVKHWQTGMRRSLWEATAA